jgi:hypothetical protein
MQDGGARPVREVLKSYCTSIRVFTIVVEANIRFILWSEDKFGNRYFTSKVRVWVSKPYIGCPYPCPRKTRGHGWASFLCIPASNSKSESNFSDARNSLEESLSIPTMVSMTTCPKQLIKRLRRISGSLVMTCLTWLSF